MRLYVEEIIATPLVQEFTRTTSCQLDRVRLHLIKYLEPAGTFTVAILDDSDNVLTSESQTLAEMQAAGGEDLSANYYHGFVSFVFDRKPTLRPGTYRIRLTATGYTYDADEFIGWVKDTQGDPIDGTYDDVPDTLADSPYDYELYVLERTR